MKNILFISPWSNDWDIENITRSPENAYFLKNLLKKFEVYHIFLKNQTTGKPLSRNHHLFPVKKTDLKEPIFFFINYLLNNFRLYFEAKKIIEKNCIDLVLCGSSRTNLAGYLIKKKLRKKVILKLYGIHTYFTSNFLKKIFMLPERISFHMPFDYIISVDDGSGVGRLRKITGFPVSKFKALKNAYPDEWQGLYSKSNTGGNKNILGVSALEKCKGFDYFIRCAQELLKERKDVVFILCGEGSERKNLEKMVKSLGIENNFKFAGGVPHPKMPEFYLKSCVLVSTNLYGNKTIPVVEAMLFGLPVIAFKVIDEEDLIKDGKNGFLVPAGNYKKIASKLSLILKDEDKRIKMGKFARKWILENYPSWDKRIREEIELINIII